ncbi:hypothetical protein PROPEN_04097 [Proteus penneri ATCC 35198]|nr:hypothetical protein PROPEN_04097 [Proteus penneri ATCC 35198]
MLFDLISDVALFEGEVNSFISASASSCKKLFSSFFQNKRYFDIIRN